MNRARDIWVFCLMIALGIANFIIFGLVRQPGWKDASEYSAYAKNLLLGNGYSLDGITISAYREPGISFYLMPYYKLFGIETPVALFASYFGLALGVGIMGYIVYRIVSSYGYTQVAIMAGAAVAFFPLFGDHANEVGTEGLYTLLVCAIFYVAWRIFQLSGNALWYLYAALGILCGYQTLVRLQFVLFLPFILGCYFLYLWGSRNLSLVHVQKMLLAVLFFAALPMSFAWYQHAHTGDFTVTQGRQEQVLYVRAERASTGISGQTRYLRDWFWRSISGGVNTQYLTDHDYKKLQDTYSKLATTTEAAARIHAETFAKIRENFGSYLYGNVIEVVKLAYIEHDYADSWSRYFRPTLYAFVYSLFLFAAYQFFRVRRNWDIKGPMVLSVLFIFYNTAILSFVYTIPRYNTPYLTLFILFGFLGVVLYLRNKEPARNLKLF